MDSTGHRRIRETSLVACTRSSSPRRRKPFLWTNPKRSRGFGRLKIRRLQHRDYSSVREIYKAASQEYLQYQRQRSGEVYDPVRPDLDTSQLDFYAATHCSFAAIENERLLGVLLAQSLRWVNDWDKVLWLEYIAVHAAHRRRGIGLALVSAAKDFARKHHIDVLSTTLNIDNEESKSLLLKAGFDVKDWRIASCSPDSFQRTSLLAGVTSGKFPLDEIL